ncbi:MAG: protein kinase domain-containing protein [Chloroflexota bacterium]
MTPQMLEQTLGHYRMESELGAGGMGVVYQATDTRLGRQVAIKILHDATLKDPDSLARFEREARVLASLNHANIAAIHGLEQAGDVRFLVLEYVPGETLAERLGRGALPPKEAFVIARQVAEALEVAHARGVIHRDLKPANIKITPDGQVKVLDFGLAKALDPVAAADLEIAKTATAPAELTRAGIVMGTVAYMSPEQASGRPVDQRTDIWAFGCVLYEMLTGARTFAGNNTTDVLVGVLDRDPDWSALPPNTPDNVRHLLRRCLMKDPRRRLHHAADVRLELEDTLEGRVSGVAPVVPRGRVSTATWIGVAAGLLIGAIAAGIWAWRDTTPTPEPRVVRFDLELPQGSRIAPSWGGVNLTFSRDAKTLLYPTILPAPLVVHARRLDESAGHPLELAKGLTNPLYSPDGRWIVMTDYRRESLVKVPLSGGASVRLSPVEMAFHGDWGRDGYIYWSNGLTSGIVRTPEAGGETEPVTTLDPKGEERNHRFAQLLPGGKALMFTVASGDMESYDEARIDVMELATKKRKTLVRGGTYARYAPSGHIVYARGGSLYAVPFDHERLEVLAPALKVLDGVLMSTNIGTAYFDISSTGDLAYAVGPAEKGGRTFHWVDRQGRESPPLPLPARSYLNPRISPDGGSLAVEVEGPSHDLYVYDFQREVMSRISHDGMSHGPIWTPDAKRIAYRTWKAGRMTLAWMPADRSGPEERLVNYTAWQSAASFSADGQHLAFDQIDQRGSASSVWVMRVTGDRQPRQFAKSGGAAKFSRDGRWLIYCSLESGRPEIYVQSWPGPGPKIQVSSEGGTDPMWRADGKEIFYRNVSQMMAVSVSTAPTFSASKPQMLWTGDYMHGLSSSCGLKGATITSYDVSRDGQRFLMIKDNDQKMYATKVTVVVNWVEELKRIVAEAAGKH